MSRDARLLVFNEPRGVRVNSALAQEIGLDQSIVLLQLEYLLGLPGGRDANGHHWTKQTLDDLHEQFPWWGRSTIKRLLLSLKEMGLLITAQLDKSDYDRSTWYTLNEEGVSSLASVDFNPSIGSKWTNRRGQIEAHQEGQVDPLLDVIQRVPTKITNKELPIGSKRSNGGRGTSGTETTNPRGNPNSRSSDPDYYAGTDALIAAKLQHQQPSNG